MRHILHIALFIILSYNCYSQNDTIYLKDSLIIYQDKEYNKIINSQKTGDWIDIIIIDNTLSTSLGSGINEHWFDKIYNEYRPLKNDEYDGIKIKVKEDIDTIDGSIYHACEYKEITNRIPPDIWFIIAKGSYKNDFKNGKWIYYYDTGEVKKEIIYQQGIPTKGFKIFREDESVMIEITKLSNSDWNICKYSDSGKLVNCEIKKTDEIKMLY